MREPLEPGRARVRRAGFTLLEVLAAVAILGIWFTVLATVAIQGLRAEGANLRKSRASLVADTALVEVETQIQNGEFPLEDVETEQDEFQIAVRPVLLDEAVSGNSESDLSHYLVENLSTISDSLYEIQIEVRWIEGVEEQTLSRSTYAWDSTDYMEAIANTSGATDEGDGESDDEGDAASARRAGTAGPGRNHPRATR